MTRLIKDDIYRIYQYSTVNKLLFDSCVQVGHMGYLHSELLFNFIAQQM